MAPRINGGFHLVLVVNDIERSAAWYGQVFGFELVRRDIETCLPDPSGRHTAFTHVALYHFQARLFLGLAQPHDSAGETFDWRRVGLQHFGFHVEERSDLDKWMRYLDHLNIAHSALLTEGPGLLVRFHDPDQIPVEVFWVDPNRGEQMLTALARLRAQAARNRWKKKHSS